MKKIMSLLLIFILFLSVNVFADDNNNTNYDQFYSSLLKYTDSDDSKESAEFKEKYNEAVKCFFENKNYKKAFKLFKNIIKKDSNKQRVSNSKAVLSEIYFKGLYVEKDYDKAMSLAKEIIKENDDSYPLYSKSLLVVGEMLFIGIGTDIDFNNGLSYIKQAASLGNEDAIKFLDKIESEGITEDNLGEKFYGVEGLKLFTKKENRIMRTINLIEIVQVLAPNVAIAGMGYISDGFPVLLIGDIDENFHKKQAIRVPPGKKIEKIGTYELELENGSFRTVPAIKIK